MASVSQNFYDQQSYAQKVRAQIKPEKIKIQVSLWFMLITATIIPVLGGFEFSLAFSVMDLLFGAELPSDPVPFNVWMLSGSAMIAVIAMHVFIEKQLNHIAIKLIDKALAICTGHVLCRDDRSLCPNGLSNRSSGK